MVLYPCPQEEGLVALDDSPSHSLRRVVTKNLADAAGHLLIPGPAVPMLVIHLFYSRFEIRQKVGGSLEHRADERFEETPVEFTVHSNNRPVRETFGGR